MSRLLQGWGGFWPNPWFLDCIRIEPPEISGSEPFSMISDNVLTHHNRHWHQNLPERLETHFRGISVQKRQDPEIQQSCSRNWSGFYTDFTLNPPQILFSTELWWCWTRVFNDLLSFQWVLSISVHTGVSFRDKFRPGIPWLSVAREPILVTKLPQIWFSTES